MTKYIPLGESVFYPTEKRLELKGGHLEETIKGELSVSEGDTTVYGAIEVKSDGSYELLEDAFSMRELTLQERKVLQDRIMEQWADSTAKKYSRWQGIKDELEFCKFMGLLYGAGAVGVGIVYLIEELIKSFK